MPSSQIVLASPTVNIHGLKVEMKPVLDAYESIWVAAGLQPVVTSGRDGLHSWGSYHYYGYAVDLRTWLNDGRQFSPEYRQQMAGKLREKLHGISPFYDVVAHATHFHIEFDWWKALRANN